MFTLEQLHEGLSKYVSFSFLTLFFFPLLATASSFWFQQNRAPQRENLGTMSEGAEPEGGSSIKVVARFR